MRRIRFIGGPVVAAAGVFLVHSAGISGLQAPPAPGGQAAAQAPAVPKPIEPAAPFVPAGFTPLFNGRDLTGWHISTTNHHGTTPAYRVMHGLIVGSQNPLGQGGILLTDRKYKNVELYTEVKPDYGCDSGLFFRSNEAGDATRAPASSGAGLGSAVGVRAPTFQPETGPVALATPSWMA